LVLGFTVAEKEYIISYSEDARKGQRTEDRGQRTGDIEYPVSGREFRVVDIPPGYTHSIENIGQNDLIVLF